LAERKTVRRRARTGKKHQEKKVGNRRSGRIPMEMEHNDNDSEEDRVG
jgi:hypothetical protein